MRGVGFKDSGPSQHSCKGESLTEEPFNGNEEESKKEKETLNAARHRLAQVLLAS
jgi:hypothetical protein